MACIAALLVFALLAAPPARAQELTSADLTLAGMRLGRNTLQEVISRFGLSPLRNGDVDELCYRSESPLQAAWVLFGAGDAGNYEKLTQFRVLSSQPAGITCPPSARVTPDIGTDSGIRIGMPAKALESKLGPRLRATADNGRVTSYEVKLQ